MAHKLKTRRVPHIRKDGKVGTKKDFRVICKRRGQVCCDQTFTTQKAADEYIERHWKFVQERRNYVSNLGRLKRDTIRAFGGQGVKVKIRVHPDIQNFSSSFRSTNRSTSQLGAAA